MPYRDVEARDAQQEHAHALAPNDTERPDEHERRRRRGGWWWKLPLTTALLLIGAISTGTFWLDRAYADRVYPNVAVQGIDISGKTRQEAQQAVEAAYAAFLQQPLTLRDKDQQWEPTPSDIGVMLDTDSSFNEAVGVGNRGERVESLRQMLRMTQPSNVPLQVVVDGTKLDTYLRQIATQLNTSAQDATITLENGQVRTTPSTTGREVLVAETANTIVGGLRNLQPQDVTLQTRDIAPRVTTEQVTEVQQTIQKMVGSPLEMVAGDQTFSVGSDTLINMMNLVQTERDGVTTFTPEMDVPKLEAFLNDTMAQTGRAPVEPRLNWNDGQLEIFQPGKPGLGVDTGQAVKAISAGMRSQERRVELPFTEVQPKVRPETFESLGLNEVIGQGKSKFAGSPDFRVQNIKAGVDLIHGRLVAPGEEFSFVDSVGRLTADKGFTEGYAIIDNRSQLEYGGGICQDSTTLFRAAFYAGLPILERNPHRFRINYYEQGETIGMDAAIFISSKTDLRFRNDTNNWILIQGSVNRKTATISFKLYGTQVPGRTVERSEPVITNRQPAPTQPVYVDDPEVPIGTFKQTDTAKGGMDVVVTRTVLQDGKEPTTDEFVTSFQSWPNIYLKNPATPQP